MLPFLPTKLPDMKDKFLYKLINSLRLSVRLPGMVWFIKEFIFHGQRLWKKRSGMWIEQGATSQACNRGVTFKDTQGHYNCCCWIGHIRVSLAVKWPVTTSLSSIVSEILSL